MKRRHPLAGCVTLVVAITHGFSFIPPAALRRGLGALAAGVLADLVGPANAVAAAGAVGALIAVPIAISWARVRGARGPTVDEAAPAEG